MVDKDTMAKEKHFQWHEQVVQEFGEPAAAAGAGAAAAETDEPDPKRRKTGKLPKKLDVAAAKAFFPPWGSPSLYEDVQDNRVRAFYITKKGKRPSHGIAMSGGVSTQEIIVALIQWLWKEHEKDGGKKFPFKV